MIRARVRALLAEVAAGTSSIDDALSRLDSEPIETLAHTTIDHHRALRSGYPEVVYGSGKTVEQVIEICASISERSAHFLVTRTTAEQRDALVSRFAAAIASDIARTVRWSASGRPDVDSRGDRPRGRVLIVTAGTTTSRWLRRRRDARRARDWRGSPRRCRRGRYPSAPREDRSAATGCGGHRRSGNGRRAPVGCRRVGPSAGNRGAH